MSLVTPHAWTAGDNATSTFMQTLTDAISQLQGSAPAAGALDLFRATQATAQTGLTSSVFTSITFATGAEIIDSASGHSETTDTSRYVGKTPGYYDLTGAVAFAAVSSGTYRAARFAKNGTAIDGSRGFATPVAGTIAASAVCAPTAVYLNGTTDYVELQGSADYASWGTIVSSEIRSSFGIRWVHS